MDRWTEEENAETGLNDVTASLTILCSCLISSPSPSPRNFVCFNLILLMRPLYRQGVFFWLKRNAPPSWDGWRWTYRVVILICRSTKTNIITWNNIWRLLLMPIYKYMYSRSHQSTQPKETMESNLQCLIFCWNIPAYLILAQTVCEMSLS